MIAVGIQDTAHAQVFELNYLPNRQVKAGQTDQMIDLKRHLVENSLEIFKHLFTKSFQINAGYGLANDLKRSEMI